MGMTQGGAAELEPEKDDAKISDLGDWLDSLMKGTWEKGRRC